MKDVVKQINRSNRIKRNSNTNKFYSVLGFGFILYLIFKLLTINSK